MLLQAAAPEWAEGTVRDTGPLFTLPGARIAPPTASDRTVHPGFGALGVRGAKQVGFVASLAEKTPPRRRRGSRWCLGRTEELPGGYAGKGHLGAAAALRGRELSALRALALQTQP